MKNTTSDYKQLKKYQKVLDKKMPATLQDFQEMKYNNREWWNRTKDLYYTNSRLQDGRWGTKINPEKQANHMKSTVRPGASYFDDDVDVQELFDTYAGTGAKENTYGRGDNVEVVKHLKIDGAYVNRFGDILPANGIKIHHSKNRTHIVPYREGE